MTSTVPARVVHSIASPALSLSPPVKTSNPTDVEHLPPHFTTLALSHMIAQPPNQTYECIHAQLDDVSILKPQPQPVSPSNTSSLCLPECRVAKQPRLLEAPELHRVHYSGYPFSLPAPPSSTIDYLAFGREGGDLLTLSLLGFWEEWLPSVELRGTISITSSFTDSFLSSLDEKVTKAVGAPMVELYFPDHWKNGIFMNGVLELEVQVRVKPRMLQIPIVIRAHNNLMLSTMGTRRSKDDGPLLTLCFSFTPHPECISRHFHESHSLYIKQQLPSYLYNAHLEMCYKLRQNKHHGKFILRLFSL